LVQHLKEKLGIRSLRLEIQLESNDFVIHANEDAHITLVEKEIEALGSNAEAMKIPEKIPIPYVLGRYGRTLSKLEDETGCALYLDKKAKEIKIITITANDSEEIKKKLMVLFTTPLGSLDHQLHLIDARLNPDLKIKFLPHNFPSERDNKLRYIAVLDQKETVEDQMQKLQVNDAIISDNEYKEIIELVDGAMQKLNNDKSFDGLVRLCGRLGKIMREVPHHLLKNPMTIQELNETGHNSIRTNFTTQINTAEIEWLKELLVSSSASIKATKTFNVSTADQSTMLDTAIVLTISNDGQIEVESVDVAKHRLFVADINLINSDHDLRLALETLNLSPVDEAHLQWASMCTVDKEGMLSYPKKHPRFLVKHIRRKHTTSYLADGYVIEVSDILSIDWEKSDNFQHTEVEVRVEKLENKTELRRSGKKVSWKPEEITGEIKGFIEKITDILDNLKSSHK